MLEKQDFPYLYSLLEAPVVDGVDCGSKCSQWNNGKPVCCDLNGIDPAIPTVYHSEWEHLKDKLDNRGETKWRPFDPAPNDKVGQRLLRLKVVDQKFIECTGPSRCKRENRSLVCRTFPFPPYFAPDGRFAGLVHYGHFDKVCWVLQNDHLVNPKFVEEFRRVWLMIFQAYPAEIVCYEDGSRDQVKEYARKGEKTPVILFPDISVSEQTARKWSICPVELRAD